MAINMAINLASKGGPLISLVMILVMLTSSLSVAEGIKVSMANEIPSQTISISCHSKTSDIGTQLVGPGLLYIFDVPGRFWSGLKYTCTFVTAGMPTTTLDVFMGWGGVKNLPCDCLGETCPWVITATGFSCNSGKYSHTWG